VKISKNIENLMMNLQILPGVGPKTAKRLALFLLGENKKDARKLSCSIDEALDSIKECQICGVLNDLEICSICSDPARDNSNLCVVETTSDLFAIEDTKEFNGKYFVLNGLLSPIDGIGPDELRINKLMEICNTRKVKEIVIALNSTLEGEATGYFLFENFKGMDIKVSKLAEGVPAGGDLDYVDNNTLKRAFSWRRVLSKD
jgi:recombination protein RecR